MNPSAAASFPAVFLRKMRGAKYRLKWEVFSQLFRLPAVPIEAVAWVPRSGLAERITDDCCMPPLPELPHDDMGVVLRIARSIPAKLICEIGTAHGNLAANLLRNCPEASLITINALAGSQTGTIVTYELAEHDIGRVYRRYGYHDRVRQVLTNSLKLDLAQYTTPDSLDLAVVDGCHDLEFVQNDFDKVRPFVRPGGVVLFHDTHPSQHGHLASSYRACLLFRRQGFDVKWIRDSWWAYWKKP